MKSILFIKFCLITVFFTLNLSLVYGQRISVTESAIKLDSGKDTNLYFQFYKGDQIIFSFSDDGKENEIRITELNGSTRYCDFNVKKVSEKIIDIVNEGAFKFYFKNTSTTKTSIFHFTVLRKPKNKKDQYQNTTVPDSIINPLPKKDTFFVDVLDQVIRLSSTSNITGLNSCKFNLPEKTVKYSYYTFQFL